MRPFEQLSAEEREAVHRLHGTKDEFDDVRPLSVFEVVLVGVSAAFVSGAVLYLFFFLMS